MNSDSFFSSIVTKKTPCVFISPHLDDAVLSAGGLISSLVAADIPVRVVTVFTQPSPRPYTLSAKSFLRQCGYRDADTLFADRRSEDEKLFGRMGVSMAHLGLTDATWRKKENMSNVRGAVSRFVPELGHRYPVHQLHVISGKIAKEDLPLIDEIGKKIKNVLSDFSSFSVFGPAAFGGHVDHVMTRKMCTSYFPQAVLWSDFPYNLKDRQKSIEGYEVLSWERGIDEKRKMIEGYATQVRAMFPKNIPIIPDQYFVPKDYTV